MKLELFTMGRNKILMRVENIADTFDSQGTLVYQQVNLKTLVDGLFTLVNGDQLPFTSVVTELSLTGNQSYEEMAGKRLHWKTVDDSNSKTEAPADTNDVIQLQQQRIRVFSVEYTVGSEQFLQ